MGSSRLVRFWCTAGAARVCRVYDMVTPIFTCANVPLQLRGIWPLCSLPTSRRDGWQELIIFYTSLLADGLDYTFTDADEASEFLAVFEALAATAEGRGATHVRHLRGFVPIDP